jgi:hypothetical protein
VTDIWSALGVFAGILLALGAVGAALAALRRLLETELPHLCDEDIGGPEGGPYRTASTDWSERPCDLCESCPMGRRPLADDLRATIDPWASRGWRGPRPAPLPPPGPPVRIHR